MRRFLARIARRIGSESVGPEGPPTRATDCVGGTSVPTLSAQVAMSPWIEEHRA
ncbi:DUF6053 domain-containing protein [Lysobacter enzymogenes]|uniref:DUF6053 domain-containing protein n=1 Tax=Lysobacter enzymogenes TaxID=69 RepID=UPI003D18FB31